MRHAQKRGCGGRPCVNRSVGADPFIEGMQSVPEDIFRYLEHMAALKGGRGELAMAYALSADAAIGEAFSLYADNPSFSGSSGNFSFEAEIYGASDFRGLVNHFIAESFDPTYFLGRSLYQAAAVGVLTRLGGTQGSAAVATSVGWFVGGSYGRALNLYDSGVRNSAELVGRSITGN